MDVSQQPVQQEKPKAPNLFAGGGMGTGLGFGGGLAGSGGMSSLSGMRPIAPQTDNVQVLGTGGTASLGGQGYGMGSGAGQPPVRPSSPGMPPETPSIGRVEPKSINIPDFLKRH